MPHKVVIIGLGRISGFTTYQEEILFKRRVTHLGAIKGNSAFELIGAIETDPKFQVKNVKDTIRIYNNIESAKTLRPDLVVICSPTNTHLYYLEDVLNVWPDATILVEKPVIKNIFEFQKLIRLNFKPNQIVVNFHRNVDPAIDEFNNFLKNVDKKCISGTATVGGGLINNGSHIISLFRELLGELDTVHLSECFRSHGDYYGTITTVYKSGSVMKISSQPEWTSVINFEMKTGNGCIKFDNDGSTVINEKANSLENVCSFNTDDYFDILYRAVELEISGHTTKLIKLKDFINEIEKAVRRLGYHAI